MKCKYFLFGFLSVLSLMTLAQTKHSANSKYMSYDGLVMAGYQGWFNCEGDGADMGWTHYSKKGEFKDGSCTIDFWPDMREYKVKYKTPFKFADGSSAYVFSSYDESTIDLHFKWMKEYGIDGVFIQRFFSVLQNPKRKKHNDKVLASAIKAATKYGIAISLMYDLGGMDDSKYKLVQEDWKHLVDDLKLTDQNKKTTYLFHNNKPLVALWGLGFKDRKSGHFSEFTKLMDFFKNDPLYGGCSIQLGVPALWRTVGHDTNGDPRLLEVVKKADIVQPWLVGRFKSDDYEKFREDQIIGDVQWCRKNGISYVPTIFPGFSWHNLKEEAPSNQIPREKGQFYWKQIGGAINSGAKMLYVAMFDEIDEGTAIMKCAKKVPVGESIFVPYDEDIPTDHYLWLTGMAGRILKGNASFSPQIPQRK